MLSIARVGIEPVTGCKKEARERQQEWGVVDAGDGG